MRTDPKAVGERSTGAVLEGLLKAGMVVLMPFGDSQRYDLVIDEGNGRFSRVQCKTGHLVRDGSVLEFHTCSSQAHRGKGKQDYRGQVELFGVYAQELDKVYLVPVDKVGRTEAYLRIRPAKNGQKRNVRNASDFELRFPVSSIR